MLVFLIIAAVVVWQLDALLLREGRKQAAVYAQKLGRPITLGGVGVKLLGGLGVKVTDVSVGPAAGEPLPLATLAHVELEAALWKAITSRGKELDVENAELKGLTINLIRFPDGTTNLERLTDKLAQTSAPKTGAPADAEPPTDYSGIRVARAALTDAKVQLIDQTRAGGPQLAISDVDVEAKNLRVGQPLTVTMKAAVLASTQNFAMTLKAAPLPATLVPTPESVSLHLQPIDLAPLGPFIPKSVGLKAGKVDAELAFVLGSAVPGGTGASSLKGVLHALGMSFQGAEGGRALDLTLDLDVSGDAEQGDLDVRKLELHAGPALVTGHGGVKGLRNGKLAVNGLVVEARNLNPTELSRYYPPLKKALHGEVDGPVGLSLRGSGTAAAQAVLVEVDLTPVRMLVPGELSKAAGAPMKLSARVSGNASGAGPLRFEATADLKGADLRPGGTLAKPPGADFDVQAVGSYLGAGNRTRVDLTSFVAHVLSSTLSGAGSVDQVTGKAPTTKFELSLKSPKLDADAMLLPGEAPKPSAASPRVSTTASSSEPAKDPHRYQGISGHVAMNLDALRYHQQDFSHVALDLRMLNDTITLDRFSCGAMGGSINASGSKVSLGPAKMPFDAHLKLKGIEISQALAAAGKSPKWVTGSFNGTIDLAGTGTDKENLVKALVGEVQGNLVNGTYLATNLINTAAEPLVKALPFVAKYTAVGANTTSLGNDIPLALKIENGVALLKQPIQVNRPEGDVKMEGGVGLSGELALATLVSLSPSMVSQLTHGKVTPKDPVPLAFKLVGPAWSPRVTGLDVRPAVKSLLAQAAAGGLRSLFGGNKSATPAQAQQALDNPKAAAEDQARKHAEDVRKLEEEAKKKLKGLFGR